MALQKKREPHMEALILQAAADIRRLNPSIDADEQAAPEAEYAEVERERQERERLWDEVERSATLVDEPAARAVDEDRGE